LSLIPNSQSSRSRRNPILVAPRETQKAKPPSQKKAGQARRLTLQLYAEGTGFTPSLDDPPMNFVVAIVLILLIWALMLELRGR
jgi:hypothetical protein